MSIVEQQKKIIIGCDLAAYDMKCEILKTMRKNGYQIMDVGCYSSHEGLYTPIAKKVAKAVASGEFDCGLLFCGTGQGMAMAANKIKGARASLCYNNFSAVMSKRDNNANILCTGAWMIEVSEAIRMIEAWLFSEYAGNHDEGLELLEE